MTIVPLSLTRVLKLRGHCIGALASVGLLALAAASAQATIVNLATGLDATDTLISLGNSPDAHWTVDQVRGGTAPARVVTAADADGIFVGGPWAADGPSSNWIAIDASQVGNDPFAPAPYSYYRQFTLTTAEVATSSISGTWGIDDIGELRLNGNLIGSAGVTDYTASTAFVVPTGSSFFTAGLNTLTITMTSSDNAYEGVRLTGTLSTVPTPGAFVGGGAILGLLGTLRLMRRKA